MKEVLDRLVIHYDVPDEIEILSQTEKCDQPEPHQSATDATDATQYENGDGINDDKSLKSTNDTILSFSLCARPSISGQYSS